MHFPTTALRAAFCSTLVLLLSLFAAPSVRAATIGEQKAAVILVNFSDNATQPITPAAANSLVFGSVSDYYWEASYQKAFLSGTTFGWFTLPLSAAICDTAKIADEGNKAATAAGADLSQYSHVIYLFPDNSGCTWSGTVGTGANGQRRVFINSIFTTANIAHELGHTFGLDHSDALDCGATTLGTSCSVRGYGDQSDTMGNRGAHFNAFQKERLGWLNAAGAPPITTVTGSGRYAIETYETPGSGAKALKILKSVDATTGAKTWYYLEYRKAIGFDSSLSGAGNLAGGLQIRTGALTNIGTSLLLDTTPNSNSISAYDVMDGALAVGSSYTDATAGVTITLAAADANGATVDVTLGSTAPVGCTRVAPALTITGPTSQVAAGATVNYSVALTNQDSSGCAATTFNLARSLPSGWSGTLGTVSLSLSPGAAGTTTLAVTSPATASAGNYGLGVGTSSSAGSVHTANAAATYSIAAATASLTEAVGTDKTSYARSETVAMSALVKNNGVAVGGATVQFTVTLPGGGSATINAVSGSDGYARGAYKIGKAKTAIGTYQLHATASSGGMTATAATSFSAR